ncbi:ArsR/SmtB family transcription factor [Kitasatospora sp. NPDC058965]|uniref:ArsR/SmtB family transcription factor n=1 Tax=Kitasatospora sp. NPDC058965 TaxID=3346682 RepID=UPI0036AACBCE
MLEIGFGVSDVARTAFAVSPLEQLLTGIADAGHHCVAGSVRRARWWRRVRQHVPRQAECLLELLNADPEEVPDFLCTDAGPGHRRLADELDALTAVSEDRLRQDLAFYGTGRQLPRIVRELREEGTGRLRQLADGARALFRACLAPDWPDIQRLLATDLAHRSRTVAQGGPGSMLDRLHPRATWRADGLLRIDTPGFDHRLELGGHGLELRPNVFLAAVTAVPTAAAHGRPTALLYPIGAQPERPAAGAVDGLAGLVGPSRARALRAIGLGPCTTAQLSERLGLSPASASAHATALRVAGAITTEREGRQVRHEVTVLGRDLLLHNPERPD